MWTYTCLYSFFMPLTCYHNCRYSPYHPLLPPPPPPPSSCSNCHPLSCHCCLTDVIPMPHHATALVWCHMQTPPLCRRGCHCATVARVYLGSCLPLVNYCLLTQSTLCLRRHTIPTIPHLSFVMSVHLLHCHHCPIVTMSPPVACLLPHH